MSYDFARLVVPAATASGIQRVFGYLTAKRQAGSPLNASGHGIRWTGVEPLAFGPFVAAAVMGRQVPHVLDIVADRHATHVPMPDHWSRITPHKDYREEVKITVGEFKLTSYDFCSVPGVPYSVRMFSVNKPIEALELAMLLELGAEQAVYDGNERRRPVLSGLFKASISNNAVIVARPDTYDKAGLAALRTRGDNLAQRLNLTGGVKIMRPKPKPAAPAAATK